MLFLLEGLITWWRVRVAETAEPSTQFYLVPITRFLASVVAGSVLLCRETPMACMNMERQPRPRDGQDSFNEEYLLDNVSKCCVWPFEPCTYMDCLCLLWYGGDPISNVVQERRNFIFKRFPRFRVPFKCLLSSVRSHIFLLDKDKTSPLSIRAGGANTDGRVKKRRYSRRSTSNCWERAPNTLSSQCPSSIAPK